MLRRSLVNVLTRNGACVLQQLNNFGKFIMQRNYTSGDERDESKGTQHEQQHNKPTNLIPGGGLEKLQGGFKEETYFSTHDLELMTKIRDAHGAQLKCEKCLGNWTEFYRMLDTNTPAQMRDSSSLNPHKNCNEEMFFLNERKECLKLMEEKLNINKHKINDISLKTQSNELALEPDQVSSSMDMTEQYTTEIKNDENSEAIMDATSIDNDNIADNNDDNDEEFDVEPAYLDYEPKFSTAPPHHDEAHLQNSNITNSSALPSSSKEKQQE